MTKQNQKGRALFYHRDSGGKHEMSPSQYVELAKRRTKELKLSFNGTSKRIESMIREGRAVDGDLFLDYGVKGNLLSRDGLNALIKEAVDDPQVTHVLISRRDRLARPDDPLDGVKLENVLRAAGKTLVFMDRVLSPLKKGRKTDIAGLITAIIAYDHSETERRNLAQKIIHAQIRLAKMGYSTGGWPPYGFRRWLVREDGTLVRQLAEGERVRMAGHHVVWLPTAEEELRIIRRILKMLERTPASRVAAQLTAEGIPSPDAGRWRKDHGIKHPVSGVWHQTTVTNIARNPLLVALTKYGVRSMGNKLRYTAEGPRELEETDFREDEKPKVIRNPESEWITAPAKSSPLVHPEQHQQLLATLDARGGTQRGKPRSHDPTRNPLGSRVFDMNCTWPMYRNPYSKSFRYTCGFYLQSHGAECAHNWVDGPTATRFVLSCLRQRLMPPTLMPKFERRLRELAVQDTRQQEADQTAVALQAELAHVQTKLTTVSDNMALAKTPAQFEIISAKFDELKAKEAALQRQIAEAESRTRPPEDTESEVAAAMRLVHHLTDLVADPGRLDLAAQAFQLTNARLFLRFRPVKSKKRTLNKIAGGMVTWGSASPPIEIYRGPTGRRTLNYNGPKPVVAAEAGKSSLPAPPERHIGSGKEDKSLRNVNRGDWI